jgi:hypothetical protein
VLELESRLIATSVVQALREKGATVREITVEPHGSGVTLRAELNGPVVQVVLPPGYFAYSQVADAMILAAGRCSMETS